MLLQDKVVVVSGIGPGLGASIALQTSKAGASVVLAARTERRLEKVAAQVREAGGQALVGPGGPAPHARLVHQRGIVMDAVDEAPVERSPGVDRLAGEEHVERALAAVWQLDRRPMGE